MTSFISSATSSMSNSATHRSNNVTLANGASADNATNEEDQLHRINLQALQNRDPYISKIVDQAQRVCVYKFIAEKRQWERKDLEGTLFVYERLAAPYHGFVILSTVSRETFVQIIKPCMEFKHTPTYEAFLQYKVDVGDIYGIWFISKNDCPRVTECLKHLTLKAQEREQSGTQEQPPTISADKSKDILSLLTTAQEKFQETKRKQEPDPNETSTAMPPLLMRLFSTQDTSTQSTINKTAVSVAELEKQFLQPSPVPQTKTVTTTNKEHLPKPVPFETKNQTQAPPLGVSAQIMNHTVPAGHHQVNPAIRTGGRLMTPADFQTIQPTQAPVLIAPQPIQPAVDHHHHQQQPSPPINQFSKEDLRHLLVDMLQNDEDFVTGLYTAYSEKQHLRSHLYS